MKHISLGGLDVSRIGLGTMAMSGYYLDPDSSDAESIRTIQRALELGVTHIDTAEIYGPFANEELIGRALKGRRDGVVVATKFGLVYYGGDGPGVLDSSPANIRTALEGSLKRLGTDRIDLYYQHRVDPQTPIEDTVTAMADLVRAGKVRYLGVSDTPAWKIVEANVMARFRGWSQFIGLQIEYSLLERSVEQELVPMALQFGLGITPWSPLKSGALSGKYTRATAGQVKADRGAFLESFINEKTFAVVDALEAIAQAHDSTVARIALAWVQAQPGVSSIIIGARRLAQLEDNLQAIDVRLTAGELDRLDALTKPTFGFPQNMQPMFPAIHNGGTTVNGLYAPTTGFGLEKGDQPY